MSRLSPSRRPVTRQRRGFTVLEIMITLTVIALLAVVAIPTYQRVLDSAALNRDMDQVAALARGAAALAAADNARVPGPEHFAEALADTTLTEGASAGVAAAPYLSPSFALYTEEEWDTLLNYPDHGSRRVAVTVTIDSGSLRNAGLAMLSTRDPGQCVMAAVVGTTFVDSHSAPVEDPLECNGSLAAAGAPSPEGPEGPGGPGGPAAPLRIFGFNMWTATGSFDDFEVTAGGSTLAADDFSGSDGVLLPAPTAQWFDVGVGLPIVTEGELTGVADETQLLAALELPTSGWTASATVSEVPSSGFMQMLIASLADGMATHLVTINAGGDVSFGGRIPGCGVNDIILNPTGVTVAEGDRVGIERISDDVASLVVNGTTVSTVDRTVLDPGLCA